MIAVFQEWPLLTNNLGRFRHQHLLQLHHKPICMSWLGLQQQQQPSYSVWLFLRLSHGQPGAYNPKPEPE